MKTMRLKFDKNHKRSVTGQLLAFWLVITIWASIGTPLSALQLPPKLWISGPDTALAPGAEFSLNFNIGTGFDSVEDLFGISFELRYSSAEFIEFPDPFEIRAAAFLQPDVYSFMRHEKENNIVYLAISRKRGAPEQSGDGVLFTLPFRIAATAPENWKACFVVSGIFANDSQGNQVKVNQGGQFCVQVREPGLDIFPNPFTPNGDGKNDDLIFEREGGLPQNWVITIMDRSGRVIRKLKNGTDRWNGRDYNGAPVLPGAYLYIIRNGNNIVRRGLLGIIR